nr:uncharacterized protein LOC124818811 [Hydra vulgaris]
MKAWFQEIFTSLIRIEDTQKTLMGMVVGLSNTKSAVNAPVEALKFSTTADELDSHLTYWLDLNDCERQSLIASLSNVTLASQNLSGKLSSMLLALAPSSVWSLYSRDGKRGKRSISPSILPIIIDSLQLRSQKRINAHKVAEALGDQLKRMPMHAKRAAVKTEARLIGTPSRAPKKANIAPESIGNDNSDNNAFDDICNDDISFTKDSD